MAGPECVGLPRCVHIGFEGKLPSRGDFVARGLPGSFLAPWRDWMDGALSAARSNLGSTWQQTWMEAPVWQFVLDGGLCGPDAVVGLWFPSIDLAGRHHPLTVAAILEGRRTAPVIEAASPWLRVAQAPALDALACDHAPDHLMTAIAAVRFADAGTASRGSWWWTDGAPLVPGVCLRQDTMPDTATFTHMLDARYGAD